MKPEFPPTDERGELERSGERVDNLRIPPAGGGVIWPRTMSREQTYRQAASELRREARAERNVSTRFELELLALAYDRLADQAQRNAQNNVVYEYDPESI